MELNNTPINNCTNTKVKKTEYIHIVHFSIGVYSVFIHCKSIDVLYGFCVKKKQLNKICGYISI